MNISKKQEGFTLIELSVVMVIVGLLVAGFFAFLNTQKEKDQLEALNETFSNARQSLAEYIADIPDQNDVLNAAGGIDEDFSHTRWSDDLTDFEDDATHYPCPAPLTAVPGDADFGVESRVGDRCQERAGVFKVTAANGTDVFIGAFPTATLQLGSENMADPYGFKLTYAVSDSVSRNEVLSGLVDPVGAIRVNDNADPANPQIKTAEFILISHGKDGKGAFLKNSSQIFSACTGGQADEANCDYTNNQATFSIEQFSESDSNSFFDDTATFNLLNLENDNLWDETPVNTNDIYNLNAGNVGVGTDTPNATLDVEGEVRMGSTGVDCTPAIEGASRYNADPTVKSMEFCDGIDWIGYGSNIGANCPAQPGVHGDLKHGEIETFSNSCRGFNHCFNGSITTFTTYNCGPGHGGNNPDPGYG